MTDPKDRYFFRNTVGISAVELFWGLGLPVIVESTFLQLFLGSLGASPRIIGLIPAVFSLGVALFSLLSAYLTSHLPMKRAAVIATHCAAAFPLVFFGLLVLWSGYGDGTVWIFLVCYFLYSLSIGVILPVWQNLMTKIFSDRKRVPGYSIMMFFQTLGRVLGSFAILKLVASFSFSSQAVGAVFLGIGLMFFLSSFFFLLVRELPAGGSLPREAHNWKTMAAAFVVIVTHRNFILYLFTFIEAYACVTVISFYANYATGFHGIEPAYAAGLFVVLVYLGAITATVLLGWFDLFSLRTKFLLSKGMVLAAIGLLFAAESLALFLVISVLLGLSRGVSLLGYTPGVKKISGREDATDYFAVSPVIVLPASFGIPFLCGLFLDGCSSWGARSYQVMFGFLGALVAVSVVLLLLVDFGDDHRK